VPEATVDQLRDLLRRQAEAASAEAVRAGGEVAAERVEALGRLARLVEIRQAAQPPRARRRWPAAVALGTTLLVVSVLLFARVPETEIELDLKVSELSFVSPREQTLAESMQLAALGASGLRSVRLPAGASGDESTAGDAAAVRLSVDPAAANGGSIDLANITLAPGDRVWLRRSEPPADGRLSLQGRPAELRVDVFGAVQVESAGQAARRLDLAAPQTVVLQSGTDEVDLDLSLAASAAGGSAGRRFASQLGANDLALVEVEEFLDPGRTLVRRISSIESGSLYFVSLGDRERKLRPREMLAFERSQGELRTLRLQDDAIELKYHGRVRGLSTGVDASRRSLMPTCYEWLSARHSLSLLWGGAFYLFGLAAAAMRWFGKPL